MPKLTRRLFIYFSAALIVFTVVLAGLFDMLLRDAVIKQNRELLLQRTQALAAALTTDAAVPSVTSESKVGNSRGGMHMRGMHHMMGASKNTATRNSSEMYCRRSITDISAGTSSSAEDATYLKNLDALAGGTVWFVDRSSKTITSYGTSDSEAYDSLPPDAEAMLLNIYKGSIVASEGFNDLLNTPSFTAGAPVRNSRGEITGALLVHQTFRALAESEQSGLRLLALSVGAAFILSLLLSLLLARRFIRPLAKMEKTAALLAEGAYGERTNITQNDEIGSLAKSLDELAFRLSAAEAERSHLEKMRRDFLTSVSHELRTPLTVLRGTVDLLTSGLPLSSEKQQALLEQAMSQTAQLERLINDLFELTRLENPDFAIEKTQGNITDALMDAARSAKRIAEEKNIHILLPEALPPIVADIDYGRIRQMLLTVLDNAIKFSPAENTIDILVNANAAQWSISVRDHGPGIDDTLLSELFMRFRSHRSESNPNGTGLGLAIAKQIAERHGITLTAANAQDGGAVFTFSGTH